MKGLGRLFLNIINRFNMLSSVERNNNPSISTVSIELPLENYPIDYPQLDSTYYV